MKCEICNKKGPKHVMEAHLKKSHQIIPEKEAMKEDHEVKVGDTIRTDVGVDIKIVDEGKITPEAASTDSKDELIAELKAQIEVLETKPAEVPTHSEFDWNKIEKCMSCGEIHPAMLMVYHAHITHGV